MKTSSLWCQKALGHKLLKSAVTSWASINPSVPVHVLWLGQRSSQSPVTDRLRSDLVKLVATVGLDLPPLEFRFLCALLLMIVTDLTQTVVWLTWQSLPWYCVSVLCPPDTPIYQGCFTQCCAKGEIPMTGVT